MAFKRSYLGTKLAFFCHMGWRLIIYSLLLFPQIVFGGAEVKNSKDKVKELEAFGAGIKNQSQKLRDAISKDAVASLAARIDFQIRHGIPDSDEAKKLWKEFDETLRGLRSRIEFFEKPLTLDYELRENNKVSIPGFFGYLVSIPVLSYTFFKLANASTFKVLAIPEALVAVVSYAWIFSSIKRSRYKKLVKSKIEDWDEIFKRERRYYTSLKEGMIHDFGEMGYDLDISKMPKDDQMAFIVQSKLVPSSHPPILVDQDPERPDILDTPGGAKLRRTYLEETAKELSDQAEKDSKASLNPSDAASLVILAQYLRSSISFEDPNKAEESLRESLVRHNPMKYDSSVFDSRMGVALKLENIVSGLQLGRPRNLQNFEKISVIDPTAKLSRG